MEEEKEEKIKSDVENKEVIKKDWLLPISIVLAALIIGGAFIYSKGASNLGVNDKGMNDGKVQNSQNIVALDIAKDQAVLGKEDAPVTIFEFGDYQCPYCQRFYMLSHLDLVKNYVDPGLAKVVFMDIPLPGHDFAQKASEATWCANDQGKYWEMHDKLFTNADKENGLTVDNIIKYAEDLGLNKDDFSNCLNSSKYASRVQEMANYVAQLGISATPSTIITAKTPLKFDAQAVALAYEGNNPTLNLGNGVLIIGAQPYSTVKSVIDSFVK